MTESYKGRFGEQLIENFFDCYFSRIFSFPNPKTKTNAQVGDVLVWTNRKVLLVEVKTRDEELGNQSIEYWIFNRIKKAVKQITNNYNRIKVNDDIFLNNSFYHTQLDCNGIGIIIGLIVLVYEEDCPVYPSSYMNDIYTKEIPIHVLAWNDLKKMTQEIDTIPDLFCYLTDRYEYLKYTDIPLNRELNALGIYKENNNKFPSKPVDFINQNYWEKYCFSMSYKIELRNKHNQNSFWFDKIENIFTDQRKLFGGYPLGLYFAWEIGALSRRERAYLGDRLKSVQSWFESGNSSRKFAVLNISTGNWIIFYFSKSDQIIQQKELNDLIRLKLIQLINDDSFDGGVYGFGFQISKIFPPQLLGLGNAMVWGADEVKDKFSEKDVEIAKRIWGSRQSKKIKEFPDLQ